MVVFNSELKNESFSQLMSCVFVCQHRGYIIDSINLNRSSQNFLKQASLKSDGFYFQRSSLQDKSCLPDKGLMQLFLHVFNISREERRHFKMPNSTKNSSSASCSCHNLKVDLAWVCSVCLGIYCKRAKEETKGECRFCGSLYDLVDFN